MRRFTTKEDTPCPIRLARLTGFRLAGEFREPKPGESYIRSAADPLEDHEPQVIRAGGSKPHSYKAHIVVPISDATKQELEQMGDMSFLFPFIASMEAFEELYGTPVTFDTDNDPED